jgi:antibiotic biosynthesis monooxygenase (ABM) superfamily enzyme
MNTLIDKTQNLVTLINVFLVDPVNQQRLLKVLVEATENVMRNLPGFISANLHASLDGKNIVNYAQWARVEDFQNMLAHEEAQVHMMEASNLSIKIEPNLYSVNHIDHI